MVVIDIKGIHQVDVVYCGCHCTPDYYIQMLRCQWFPGSVEFPCTTMTFAMLRHFQLLSFMLKASAYEYYHTLEQLMDNTGVHCSLVGIMFSCIHVHSMAHTIIESLSGVSTNHARVASHMDAEASQPRE